MKTLIKSIALASIVSAAMAGAVQANPFAQDPTTLEVNNFLDTDMFRTQSLRNEVRTQGGVAVITGGTSVVFSVDPEAAYESDIFGRSDYEGQNQIVVGGGVSQPLKPSQKFHPDPDALHI